MELPQLGFGGNLPFCPFRSMSRLHTEPNPETGDAMARLGHFVRGGRTRPGTVNPDIPMRLGFVAAAAAANGCRRAEAPIRSTRLGGSAATKLGLPFGLCMGTATPAEFRALSVPGVFLRSLIMSSLTGACQALFAPFSGDRGRRANREGLPSAPKPPRSGPRRHPRMESGYAGVRSPVDRAGRRRS
jgi:hypothetical protein